MRPLLPPLLSLLLSACGPLEDAAGPRQAQGDGPAGSDTGGGAETGDDARDTGASTDTGAVAQGACPEEPPAGTDWSAAGPYAVGMRSHYATLEYRGETLPFYVVVYYPASWKGLGAPAEAEGGPHPVLIFEHAYGAAPDEYDWLFRVLASRGWVIAAPEHDSGEWNSVDGGYFESHAFLGEETLALLQAWQADPDDDWAGMLDLERLALGGHSHGAGSVLRLAQRWRPMADDGAHEVDAVLFLSGKPDWTEYFEAYELFYDGMPAFMHATGGADVGGDMAYGQAVATYDQHGRPGAYLYVDGAEHYSWTDHADDSYATVERAVVHEVALPAVVSFLAAAVEGDAAGADPWRGDVVSPWRGQTASREQWHDEDTVPIDAFEDDGGPVTHSAAVAGIPGRTFVNGFTNEAFLDPHHAWRPLLEAQVAALLPEGGTALLYDDREWGLDMYGPVLAGAPGVETTTASSEAELADHLATGDWDLVVVAEQRNEPGDATAYDDALEDWVCGGGRTILADNRLASEAAARIRACAGATWDGVENYRFMASGEALLTEVFGLATWFSDGPVTFGLETTATAYAWNEVRDSGAHDLAVADSGASVTAEGFELAEEVWAVDEARALYSTTWALELAWTTSGATVSWDLGEVDVRDHPVLSLRLLAVHDDPYNPTDEALDLDIEIVDADGDAVAWSLSDAPQGALQPTPWWLPETTPKSVFATWRVPVRRLAELHPELDLERIAQVRLATVTASGRVLVDDLEWSAGEGCW